MTCKSSLWLPTILAAITATACGPEDSADAPNEQTRTAKVDHGDDAGAGTLDAAPEDSGMSSVVDATDTPNEPELEGDDGATHHGDAAPDETPITESIITEYGVCNGTPLCGGEPCECDAVDGDGGCAVIHCEQHHTRSQCANAAGCEWEIVTDVNEGTVTGKRCTGDVGSCEGQNWECKTGCEETFDGNRRVCSGTPEPCSAKVYEADCGRVLQCTWQ